MKYSNIVIGGGGVLGSTIGSGAGSVAATIGGGLLGGWLGNSIGTSLDNADRNTHARISQRAMETGKTQSWNNSHNGNHGSFTPHKRYKNNDGEYCRDDTGHACRSDGRFGIPAQRTDWRSGTHFALSCFSASRLCAFSYKKHLTKRSLLLYDTNQEDA